MVSRKPHPAELRERAVQMAFGLRAETGEARGSIARVGHGLGINTETLRNWVNKAEVDSGSGRAARPVIRSGSPSWNGKP
jgi:transposase